MSFKVGDEIEITCVDFGLTNKDYQTYHGVAGKITGWDGLLWEVTYFNSLPGRVKGGWYEWHLKLASEEQEALTNLGEEYFE